MNKSYVLTKFQNMPRKNLAKKTQNAVGPQLTAKCESGWVYSSINRAPSLLHSMDLQRENLCASECVTGYIFGTQILQLIIKSELNGW